MYHDIVFPVDYGYQTSGGPGYRTIVSTGDSGHTSASQRWDTAVRRYRVNYNDKNLDQGSALLDFFMAREGSEHTFKFKDYLDFSTAVDHRGAVDDEDVQIGVGDGTTTTFQLQTKYTDAVQDIYRVLTKPKADTVVVAIDAVSASSGWSVDDSTGIITFTTAPLSGEVITAGCEFYVWVRFGEETGRHFEQSYENVAQINVLGDIILTEELPTDTLQPSKYLFGGASHITMSEDTLLTAAQGRVINLTATTTSLNLILDSVGKYAPGGPHFYFINSGANAVTLQLGGGVTGNLGAGFTCIVVVKVVGTTKLWACLS